MTRAQIAAGANEKARCSRRRLGAPYLTEDSKLQTLLDWCDWNDPNGEWARLKAEYVTADVWDVIQGMLL
jgi:hypothetical protein